MQSPRKALSTLIILTTMNQTLYNLLYNDSRKLRTIYKVLLVLVSILLLTIVDNLINIIEYRTTKVYVVTSDDCTYHIYDWCPFAKREVKDNNGILLDVRFYKLEDSQYKCCEYCSDYYKTKIEIQNHK